MSKELTAGKEIEGQRQLLMFGLRNKHTKSRKERNYAPLLANSCLRRCLKAQATAANNLMKWNKAAWNIYHMLIVIILLLLAHLNHKVNGDFASNN